MAKPGTLGCGLIAPGPRDHVSAVVDARFGAAEKSRSLYPNDAAPSAVLSPLTVYIADKLTTSLGGQVSAVRFDVVQFDVVHSHTTSFAGLRFEPWEHGRTGPARVARSCL